MTVDRISSSPFCSLNEGRQSTKQSLGRREDGEGSEEVGFRRWLYNIFLSDDQLVRPWGYGGRRTDHDSAGGARLEWRGRRSTWTTRGWTQNFKEVILELWLRASTHSQSGYRGGWNHWAQDLQSFHIHLWGLGSSSSQVLLHQNEVPKKLLRVLQTGTSLHEWLRVHDMWKQETSLFGYSFQRDYKMPLPEEPLPQEILRVPQFRSKLWSGLRLSGLLKHRIGSRGALKRQDRARRTRYWSLSFLSYLTYWSWITGSR